MIDGSNKLSLNLNALSSTSTGIRDVQMVPKLTPGAFFNNPGSALFGINSNSGGQNQLTRFRAISELNDGNRMIISTYNGNAGGICYNTLHRQEGATFNNYDHADTATKDGHTLYLNGVGVDCDWDGLYPC